MTGLTPAGLWHLLSQDRLPPAIGPIRKGAHQDLRLMIEGRPVPTRLLLPDGNGPYPAILFCHAHGNKYEIGRAELTDGRPAWQNPPIGPKLAQLGCAVLCIDMPGFGDRRNEGSETAMAKALAWQGRTLMGQMLAELSAALDWLAARPDIDASRMATLGLSMGATHAYWLAALRPELAATVHLCAFADMAGLITSGSHDLHGPYMTVPGLLKHGDMGDVAALVAPRPQLVCLGGLDPLTPSHARDPALDRLTAAYGATHAADALQTLVDPSAGHEETPEMRARVLAFLTRNLIRA